MGPRSTGHFTRSVDGAVVREGHASHLFPCVAPYYREPIVAVGGRGTMLVDAEGIEYLDGFSGILTTSLGHCHPEVNGRVKAQIDRLGHTSTLYLTAPQVEAAERLAAVAPGDLRRCMFTNSGSEAIESAIIAARLYTGRSEVIALRWSYHGRSILATNLTGHAAWRPLETAIAGVHHARAPYLYWSREQGLDEASAAEVFARDLEEVVVSATSGAPAAFIAETILGVGGYVVPPRGYFERAAEIIRGYGGLFICDEVQAGLGRTGTWFAIERWGVVPDILVLAKGLANGYPAGATVTTDEIAAAWTRKTISTFGGNPVSMAAAAATLEVMVREDVPARSRERGAQLRAGLDALAGEYPWVGEVRGLGLMQALELVEDRGTKAPSPAKAAALLEAAKAERLLIGIAGVHGNVIRIAPSLLITGAEVEEVLDRLHRACARVERLR